jgi:uncharacterized protein (DUF58 family)
MKMLQRYWDKWLNKRIPAATQHQLNHQNIFIFPAKFGLFFLSLCLLLFLLGTNYQNNVMLLLCYFLLALFLINLLASYINFAQIDLQIGKCPEVFVGDNLTIPLWLNANNHDTCPTNGLLYFKLQVVEHLSFKHLPLKHTKRQRSQSVTRIDVNDDAFSNPINLSQKCQQRGKLTLSRVTVESFYPLGLYRCWTHLAFIHNVSVFPKPVPCEIQLYANEHHSTKKSTQWGDEQSGHDDFSHLKAYQLGESLNHVAWKQLAKGRGMVSKQFTTTGQHTGWLKLSFEHKNHALSQSNAESEKLANKITLSKVMLNKIALNKEVLSKEVLNKIALDKELGELCYQVIELSRTQRTFGLDLGVQCIAPSRGAEHRLACLHALAYFPDFL